MEEERYTKMIFTPSELLYIVASLGLPATVIQGNPYKGYSKEALRQEIVRGRQGLEEKRMLERTINQGWELDGRVSALMEVIVKADYSLGVTMVRKPSTYQQFTLFFMKNQAISMSQESRYYHLGIFQGEKALVNVLLTLLGVEQQLSQGFEPLRLPVVNFASLVLAVWKDTEAAVTVLRSAGMAEEEAAASAPVVTKSEIAAMLAPEFRGQSTLPLRRSYLLSGKTFLYWGEVATPQDEFVTLNPLPFSHTAITKAPEYDETILFDPTKPNVTANILRLIKRESFKEGKPPSQEQVFQ
ncbi:MAG: hypothetical protein ACOY16_10365 [Chloroflexota bacterium]